jgi:hypothetical protein
MRNLQQEYYVKQVATLAGRLTLYTGEIARLSTYSTTRVNDKFEVIGMRWVNETPIPREVMNLFVRDLNMIYINHKDNYGEELNHFAIVDCAEDLQAWYDMMRKGTIASAVVSKFGVSGWDENRERINELKAKLEITMPKYIAEKPEPNPEYNINIIFNKSIA